MTPTDAELTDALVELKAREPQLGISKIRALLIQHYPTWVVSEKRTKKILQSHGLTNSHSNPNNDNSDIADIVPKIPYVPKYTSDDYVPPAPDAPREPLPPLEFPTSKTISDLDVSAWSAKVAVRVFEGSESRRGKGIVAIEDLEEGEVVWKEDPWIVAPEWDILDLQSGSVACAYCTTPLSLDSPLVIPCSSASESSSSSSTPTSTSTKTKTTTTCPMRFCNRLCLARSSKVHPLLCPVQNPASIPLLKYARACHWMALHALAHVTSRIVLVNEHSEQAMRKDWEVVDSWAVLGMRERVRCSYSGAAEPDLVVWEKGHRLYRQAFVDPKTPLEKKRLAKLVKKSLPKDVDRALFDYEEGFLKMLGKMNLNMEAHGGIYTLHSHLNHSCNPNVSVRHLDRSSALSRITILAKRRVKAGEELLITYVNPKDDLDLRQEELRAWGFGKCRCERCVAEEKAEMRLLRSSRLMRGRKTGALNGYDDDDDDDETEAEREERDRRVQMELDEMVREMKANLGVV